MILDQGIGAHDAQVEYLTLGWAATWVSGESVVEELAKYIIGGTLERSAITGTFERSEIVGTFERLQ